MPELQIFRQACLCTFFWCVFTPPLLEAMCVPFPCKPRSGCSEILPVIFPNLCVFSCFSFLWEDLNSFQYN